MSNFNILYLEPPPQLEIFFVRVQLNYNIEKHNVETITEGLEMQDPQLE